MKSMLLIAICAGLSWTMPATANEEHHPGQKQGGSAPQTSVGTKAPQKLAVATAQAGPSDSGKSAEMMANMEKMQDQMKKIHATTDRDEQQKLMKEHMHSMHVSMQGMQGMRGMGGAMTDSPPTGKMAMGQNKDMKSGDMMNHHDMMQKRMDMMQMMMEQMVQHQHAQEMAPK